MWLLYVSIAIVLMSLNIFIVKKLIKKVNPYLIILYQYLIAVPIVIIYSLFSNAELFTGNVAIIFLGVVYVTAIVLYYIALKKGSLSKVTPVFNMKMIIPAILGIIFLSETISIQLIIGLLFGALGVYFLGSDKK